MRGWLLLTVVLVLGGCAAPSKPEAPPPPAPPVTAAEPRPARPPRANLRSTQAHQIKHNLDKAIKGLDKARSANERRSYILDTRDEKALK